MSEKQKVHVEEVDAISWECPKCGTYNIQDKYINLILGFKFFATFVTN